MLNSQFNKEGNSTDNQLFINYKDRYQNTNNSLLWYYILIALYYKRSVVGLNNKHDYLVWLYVSYKNKDNLFL